MPPPKDPFRYFRLEASELADQLDAAIVAWEQGEDSGDLLLRMLRHAHTLKGAARVVKQVGIANEAHAIEDLLAPLRNQPAPANRPLIDALIEHVAVIRARLATLSSEPKTPSEVRQVQASSSDEDRPHTIRAELGEVDLLLDGVSEAYTQVGGLRANLAALERAQHMSELLRAQLDPRSRGATRPAQGSLDHAHAIAADLSDSFAGIERRFAAAIDQTDRELRQLRDNVEQMRLMPASLFFPALESTAADAARTLGKQIRFEAMGGDIRLDAPVLETMRRALVQLVRNAAAHGIEPEAQRLARSKPAAGLIRLTVTRQGSDVFFACTDDGSGIDLGGLRQAVRDRGLAGPDIAQADANALLRVLMGSGISTADHVTEVSGRGIGLDIVRAAIEQLHGEIALESEAGVGTTFRIRVPFSLTSAEVLHVVAGKVTLGVPIEAVASAVRLTPEQIAVTADGASILHEGAAIAFAPLEGLLNGTPPQESRSWSALILRGTSGLVAIGVDRLLGASPIVVRPIPARTPCSAILAGASLDADGNPQLLLDSNALIAAVHARGMPVAGTGAAALPVLIIDDSLTTRMLEQSILEAAGYEVDSATSAEEGLEAARRRRYALFLVDVEMPGMDGFTFVERIRADPALHDIPAILVTSRNAPEDLQRGKDVGAQGYVVKGEFDQNRLLALISELVR